tara:strand:+ start:1322 stop:1585 length:264 start_codon:yes stop_codon:yes gene_type:complete
MNTDSAKQIKYDTLSILLCNRVHSGLSLKHRAVKLANTCKKIQAKTKDKVLYGACGRIIKSVSGHNYLAAIKEVSAKEINYFKVYGV